jgi:hypothetical protein
LRSTTRFAQANIRCTSVRCGGAPLDAELFMDMVANELQDRVGAGLLEP